VLEETCIRNEKGIGIVSGSVNYLKTNVPGVRYLIYCKKNLMWISKSVLYITLCTVGQTVDNVLRHSNEQEVKVPLPELLNEYWMTMDSHQHWNC